jgi:hypothetical protein
MRAYEPVADQGHPRIPDQAPARTTNVGELENGRLSNLPFSIDCLYACTLMERVVYFLDRYNPSVCVN